MTAQTVYEFVRYRSPEGMFHTIAAFGPKKIRILCWHYPMRVRTLMRTEARKMITMPDPLSAAVKKFMKVAARHGATKGANDLIMKAGKAAEEN